jgi:hypothetical protein
MLVQTNRRTGGFLHVIWTLLVTVFLSELGCGKSDLGRVSGRVTLDGQPVQGAIILFQPEGRRPSYAWLNADGKFALQYNAGHKGAAIGSQKVQLKEPAEDQLAKLPHGIEASTKIPPKFLEPFQTVEVKAGGNEFNFELKSD